MSVHAYACVKGTEVCVPDIVMERERDKEDTTEEKHR